MHVVCCLKAVLLLEQCWSEQSMMTFGHQLLPTAMSGSMTLPESQFVLMFMVSVTTDS